jgi:Chalcone isomerase-like
MTLPICRVARAVALDNVQLPDTLEVNGRRLILNGYGLRTYSILGIHVYVAGLYLEHPGTDPEQIIHSPGTKLLVIRFEHSVSADAARKAWRDGLADNCQAPCQVDPNDVTRFLANIPAMHEGDNYSLLFTRDGVSVSVDGRLVGVISKRSFAEAMLATFLGPRPASERLKQELLQGHP